MIRKCPTGSQNQPAMRKCSAALDVFRKLEELGNDSEKKDLTPVISLWAVINPNSKCRETEVRDRSPRAILRPITLALSPRPLSSATFSLTKSCRIHASHASIAPRTSVSLHLLFRLITARRLMTGIKSFFPNHYPIPLTLGICQAQRYTTSLQVDFGTRYKGQHIF